MPNPDEQDTMEDIDRDVSQKGGLVMLVICLIVAMGLVMAGAMGIAGQG